MKTACTPTKATDCFHHTRGFPHGKSILEVTMENRTILTEQIKRLLALADEKQLRLLYIAALQLV